MYHQNIRDLSTNYECLGEILDSHQGMGIISLSETHTNEGNEKRFAIQGYDYFVRSKVNGDGGGVAFYIKQRLKWTRRYDLEFENIECAWVKIFVEKSQSFLNVYFIAHRIAQNILQKASKKISMKW